jgi:S-(hydroxymethyl)glutathione dehydrogenase / alcohol dehydrogenase
MKTKGALIWEFNQPWSIEEIEIGDPVKDEVKIQMEASGMCHSDHHLVTGDIPMAGFPVLGGHEGARTSLPATMSCCPSSRPAAGARPVRQACETCATSAPACSVARPSPTTRTAFTPRASRCSR